MTSWLTFRQASFSLLCYSKIRHFHCWVLGRKQIKKHYFPFFFIPGTILLENMKLNKVWNCVNSQRSSNPLFLLMGHQSTGSGIPIYLSFIGARQATIFLHFPPLKKSNIPQISNLWWMPNSVIKGLTLPWKRPCQDDSKDTLQVICDF